MLIAQNMQLSDTGSRNEREETCAGGRWRGKPRGAEWEELREGTPICDAVTDAPHVKLTSLAL